MAKISEYLNPVKIESIHFRRSFEQVCLRMTCSFFACLRHIMDL